MHKTPAKTVNLLATGALFLGIATALSAEKVPTANRSPQDFVKSHCIACHDASEQNGEISLESFLRNEIAFERDTLVTIYDQINLERMPPDSEEQPSEAERAEMLIFLQNKIRETGTRPIDKRLLPGYGNYVNHEALFDGELAQLPATPPRIWRYSPESFSQRVNQIAGHDVIRFIPIATFPVPQTGLKHPAFPYKGPAHTAKDFANIHDFGLTETELLIGLAEELASAQFASGTLKDFRNLPPGHRDWDQILDDHFTKLYRRTATADEKRALLDLQRKVAQQSNHATANHAMIAATYLRPESLFRFETGDPTTASDDHVSLTPLEYAVAVGCALNRTGPSFEDVSKFQNYTPESKDKLREVIRPMLDRDEAHKRIMRFMNEYFEYGNAAFVFKDKHHRRYRPGWMIEDVEKFVSRIVQQDQNVLKELLTSREYNVRGAFNTKSAPKWFQDETNGHLFYHDCYNLGKEDLGKDPEWRDFGNQRAGVLCHPAWLIAFSDNTKNHAIQRGRWIRTKLLAGVIPDTPVEVDARFPDDPKLTLREKMQVVRKQECWKCHQQMDPLGLPFEQFDLWGRYRTTELDRPVDTSGELDGSGVKDPVEMLQRLASSKRVHQVFLRHVFRFFSGRNETLGDAEALRNMEHAYHENGGSLKASLLELFVSDSFIQRQRATLGKHSTPSDRHRTN